MGTNRMTDDGKPCSLGTVTLPYHSRWHIERTLSPLLGMESRAVHTVGKLSTPEPQPGLASSKSAYTFSLWKMRPKILFDTTSTLVLVIWIVCFGSSLFCLASWQPLSPCWLKHHIPTDWLFLLKKPFPALSTVQLVHFQAVPLTENNVCCFWSIYYSWCRKRSFVPHSLFA